MALNERKFRGKFLQFFLFDQKNVSKEHPPQIFHSKAFFARPQINLLDLTNNDYYEKVYSLNVPQELRFKNQN